MILKRVAFIGAGNMAEALVKGLVAGKVCAPGALTVTDPREERRAFFQKAFGVHAEASNAEAAKHAEVLFLAVKPQVLPAVLQELAGAAPATALVVSIAAGTRTAAIESALGGRPRVVRVMPNTPALVGQGASAICPGRWATDADLEAVERMMAAVGLAVRVTEAEMDAVTALSGSGPAYVFLVLEAMLAAGEKMGLAPAVARALALQTVAGAAKLAAESDATPGELRERVTSKGGTTAAALEVLREAKFHDALAKAILAAQKRSRELSGA
jgi:pyrroline-5-carboxylate reductase